MKRIYGGQLSREAKPRFCQVAPKLLGRRRATQALPVRPKQSTQQSRVSPPPARGPTGRVGRHRPDAHHSDSDSSRPRLVPAWQRHSEAGAAARAEAVVARPGRARLDLGDRSSARFGGRRRSSPPWDHHRRPARTTASIGALARRLQARDARLWRISGRTRCRRSSPALVSAWCSEQSRSVRGHASRCCCVRRLLERRRPCSGSSPQCPVSSKALWCASRNRVSTCPVPTAPRVEKGVPRGAVGGIVTRPATS
jgi:hypothetical protein